MENNLTAEQKLVKALEMYAKVHGLAKLLDEVLRPVFLPKHLRVVLVNKYEVKVDDPT